MKNKIMSTIIFSIGVAVGSFITYEIVKNKYEQLTQREINSVKEHFEKKYKKKDKDEKVCDSEEKIHDVSLRKEEENIEKEKVIYNNMAKKYIKNEIYPEKPYIISPEEFGEKEEYDKLSLTYYSDGYLADEMDELIENLEEAVGFDSLNHFGEYEADSVFVRNDIQKIDYEILYDSGKYLDVIRKKTRY